MGYTLISRTEFDNVSTANIDFTLNSDYDEILFVLSGFKSDTDERDLAFQFITSGESGYDRPTQSTMWGDWLYAFDYSHGGDSYQSARDSDISEAGTTATQFIGFTSNGDTHKNHSASSGELVLYKPHDTSFYKYFLSESANYTAHVSDFQQYMSKHDGAGYVKDTAALTGIRFVSANYQGDQDGNILYIDLAMYGLS